VSNLLLVLCYTYVDKCGIIVVNALEIESATEPSPDAPYWLPSIMIFVSPRKYFWWEITNFVLVSRVAIKGY
jgi:hypothetical protein